METLRLGSVGEIVAKWQAYLRGLDLYLEEISGSFDENTALATKIFQRNHGLVADGIAGNHTLGIAMAEGFSLIGDSEVDYPAEEAMPTWPPKPVGLSPANLQTRNELFGTFNYKAAPAPTNPEAIIILGDWVQNNIEWVDIPQLKGIPGAGSGKIQFNKKASAQLKNLFQAWEEAGLIDLLKTWGGSFVPRFVRGSKTSLSNHSTGSAFDINITWNNLGQRPALVGQTGSVRKLVPLANEFGFYWGGHYGPNRLDGMHFECTKLL